MSTRIVQGLFERPDGNDRTQSKTPLVPLSPAGAAAVLAALVAIPGGWLAVKVQEAKRQRETAIAVERKLFGEVKWSQPVGQAG